MLLKNYPVRVTSNNNNNNSNEGHGHKAMTFTHEWVIKFHAIIL